MSDCGKVVVWIVEDGHQDRVRLAGIAPNCYPSTRRPKPALVLLELPMSAHQAPEFAVGWGTLALLNAGIAQGKNRSGLNWFLLSLLLGPIATFLLVAFFPKLPRLP